MEAAEPEVVEVGVDEFNILSATAAADLSSWSSEVAAVRVAVVELEEGNLVVVSWLSGLVFVGLTRVGGSLGGW